MHEAPRPEHQWLHQLVGEWTFESEMVMGPDGSTATSSGTESVRSLGGFWTIGEGEGVMPGPEGGSMKSIMTLGYDARGGHYVGTFVASPMGHLWVYRGSLDESGKVLTMGVEGPSFVGEGTSQYQDIIEILDADRRTLTSRLQMPDGSWVQFMKAEYTRKR